MNSKEYDFIAKLFKKAFNKESDKNQLDRLVNRFGYPKVLHVLDYFSDRGVNPPGEGKKNNPYGLLYLILKNWIF
jgi:hypothetical protein